MYVLLQPVQGKHCKKFQSLMGPEAVSMEALLVLVVVREVIVDVVADESADAIAGDSADVVGDSADVAGCFAVVVGNSADVVAGDSADIVAGAVVDVLGTELVFSVPPPNDEETRLARLLAGLFADSFGFRNKDTDRWIQRQTDSSSDDGSVLSASFDRDVLLSSWHKGILSASFD